jgi:hypothetical protein
MNNIDSKIKRKLKTSITKRYKLNKGETVEQWLGCSIIEFKEYIESLMTECMSWNNWGVGKEKWQLDHVIPLRLAENRNEHIELNAYQNFQPLWDDKHKAKTINGNIIRDCSKIKGGKIGKQKLNDNKR